MTSTLLKDKNTICINVNLSFDLEIYFPYSGHCLSNTILVAFAYPPIKALDCPSFGVAFASLKVAQRISSITRKVNNTKLYDADLINRWQSRCRRRSPADPRQKTCISPFSTQEQNQFTTNFAHSQ
jgi:hypothetical protein